MLEVTESIEIPPTDVKVKVLQQNDNEKENSVKEIKSWQHVVKKYTSWRVFKLTVFILSLICLIIQSMEFLETYYEYPTNIVLETTVNNDFKLPAVTLCFLNTVSTDTFCQFSPSFCESPNNLKEFCLKHPIYCKRDTTTLKIPMTGYYTNHTKNLIDETKEYFPYDHFNEKDLYSTIKHRNTPITRTFILDAIGALKCFSENLHLYQNKLPLETLEVDFSSSSGFFIMGILVNLYKINLYYASKKPQVFLAIHSPFVPVNPTLDGHALYPGKLHKFQLELEREEHRLPPPYQTSCRDNGPSKDAKPFTNPNSYQMCLEMCKSEFSTTVYDCNMALTMISSVKDMCFAERKVDNSIKSSKILSALKKKRHSCMQNCKQECLKLHYKYEIAVEDLDTEDDPNNYAKINIFVKNTEVTILRHVPMYGDGETYSYIGGLAGFWLGYSVFTFTDTIEDFCKKILKWKGLRKDDVHCESKSEN